MLSFFPRPQHLVKNLLVFPGSLLAYCLLGDELEISIVAIFSAFISCTLIASWNYALNDYLDRAEDAHHPEKSERVKAENTHHLKKCLVLKGAILLGGATSIALWAEFDTGLSVFLGLFLLSGIVYNVYPLRLKRLPFIDVATEAINFPIRLAIGWYALTPTSILPPLSAMLAIWSLGGVLLTGKRAAELARIGNPITAKSYRPALLHYTKERALVISSLYGMVMLFGSGILFAVYSPLHNLIFLLPFILLLMGIYLWKLADSEINTRELEPEKLLRKRSVWLAILLLGLLATILMILPVDLAETLHFFGQ
jgi:decaprenyl-phosphate phosphoribosyltransferase